MAIITIKPTEKCHHQSRVKQKKNQNGRLRKFKMAASKKTSFSSSANSQYFFMKFLWFGPWVSRIDWCEGHWNVSTYMVVRLSDKQPKNTKNTFFVCFWAFFCTRLYLRPNGAQKTKLKAVCVSNIYFLEMAQRKGYIFIRIKLQWCYNLFHALLGIIRQLNQECVLFSWCERKQNKDVQQL